VETRGPPTQGTRRRANIGAWYTQRLQRGQGVQSMGQPSLYLSPVSLKSLSISLIFITESAYTCVWQLTVWLAVARIEELAGLYTCLFSIYNGMIWASSVILGCKFNYSNGWINSRQTKQTVHWNMVKACWPKLMRELQMDNMQARSQTNRPTHSRSDEWSVIKEQTYLGVKEWASISSATRAHHFSLIEQCNSVPDCKWRRPAAQHVSWSWTLSIAQNLVLYIRRAHSVHVFT
jgi:hypothetical protein